MTTEICTTVVVGLLAGLLLGAIPCAIAFIRSLSKL